MALTRISPIQARVGWNRGAGRPTFVEWADRHLTVTSLAAVRDETAAYPVDAGPRLIFQVVTDGGPATLVFDERRRRWFVEALDLAA